MGEWGVTESSPAMGTLSVADLGQGKAFTPQFCLAGLKTEKVGFPSGQRLRSCFSFLSLDKGCVPAAAREAQTFVVVQQSGWCWQMWKLL